ncbi:large conductance mechanosensitive channel protein MscL [Kutzneria sp. CA-103260]|uniref:large conductance mechanosensitive channel protein MscL n=1 Tax=Kutzneria sp. CA-103260 TaxID=2802641 RepID=UPI001BA5CB30|nr:large conductance mechanosensitive channel protein MscL [Kutzneria sp. CA-103260]QUQ69318.1 large conductance mechanosensitive channel, MscL family [Kutzneria sp. CA-103260]
MLKGFRDFLFRGNIVDLAVAVVIGTAFTALVTALGNAFINPLVKAITGGEIGGTFTVVGVTFDYGLFITAVINFVIIAAVVYFLIVVPVQRITNRFKKPEEAKPAGPTDIELLTEIRDLLRAQQGQR